MTCSTPLGLKHIAVFILYVLCVMFTAGFASAFLSGLAQDALQTLAGPIATFIAAREVARKHAATVVAPPAPRARLTFAILAALSLFALLFATLATLVLRTKAGFAGLPVDALALGAPIVLIVTVASAYAGLSNGYLKTTPRPSPSG